MTECSRAAGRWPVVASVAPAAALLFSGAAAWASLTAPQPSQAAPGAAATTAAPRPTPDGTSPPLAVLQRRLEADRKRLDQLRRAARAPQAPPAPRLAPASAAPRPAAPPPPVDTTTGASG